MVAWARPRLFRRFLTIHLPLRHDTGGATRQAGDALSLL
jgi:hypothetical protein